MSLCDQDVAMLLARLDEIGCLIQQNLTSPWMNTAEAAKYLRCSASQVEKLTHAGLLPFRRLDPNKPKSHRLYHRKHLTAYIITGKNPATQRLTPDERRMVEDLCA